MFDFAYLLAHVVLHTFTNPTIAVNAVESYLKGYGKQDYNEEMVKQIVLGIILYRLSSIIPYPTQLTPDQKEIVQKKTELALPLRLKDATWPELIHLLQYE